MYEVVGCEDQPSCQFQNAGETANGTVNLQRSLTVSSDWYYYHIGDNLWGNKGSLGEDYLQDTAVDWGFTEDTGIDLAPGTERFRLHPRAHRRAPRRDTPTAYPYGDWTPGTPSTCPSARATSASRRCSWPTCTPRSANGGTLYRPHVGMATLRPVTGTWEEDPGTPCIANDGAVDEGALCTVDPTQVGAVEIPARWRDPMIAGLLGVAQSSQGGTSGPAFDGFDLAGFPIGGRPARRRSTARGTRPSTSGSGRSGRVRTRST